MICPVCSKTIYGLEKWRGIYICTPDRKKFEKIEKMIKEGQVLEGPALDAVLNYFGPKEEEVIRASFTVRIKKKRKKKVEGIVIGVKPRKRRKRLR